jgi:Acetyltransferase (GNAT) domain
MMVEEVSAECSKELLTNSIFQSPWWLDAVAPGEWAAVEVKSGGVVMGRMPYVLRRKSGLTLIAGAPLTQTLGPWIRTQQAKYERRFAHESEVCSALIQQLPGSQQCLIPCHPSITNLLPFYWAGFDIGVRYTYRLEDLSDSTKIWDGVSTLRRRDIRKAEEHLIVRDDLGLDAFCEVNALSFKRQGLPPPYARETVERLDEALSGRNRRRILFAVDARERVHAVAYFVWDADTTYYLMGGADPDLRSSGASTLLLWNGIKYAADTSRRFDFEGSMIRPIENFVRSFGAVQTPYYQAVRLSPLIKVLSAARQMFSKPAPR